MEEIKNGGICPLTGWEIVSDIIQDNGYRYDIKCARYSFTLWVTTECWESSVLAGRQHIIRWLLFNGKIKTVETQVDQQNLEFVYSEERLLNLIEETFIPRTPNEKADQLLILLNKFFPKYKGGLLKQELFDCSFFEDIEEFEIYLNALVEFDYVKIVEEEVKPGSFHQMLGLPYSSLIFEFKVRGIQKLTLLEENGRVSKNCFIAMSFSEKVEIVAIKESIKSAIYETGYHPIIINEKHIDSDQTINDAIIAEIKRAKFVVADFTEQKSGVFFEAGFALGLGIPVIYCCEEEDFKNNSHFDVNHYPHILYKTPEQLRKSLVDKIRAWID